MKAVLVGTDLMYRKDRSLAPIEINTNVGWDEANRVESEDEIWDLTDLVDYVNSHNIEEVVFLPGTATKIVFRLKKLLPDIVIKITREEEEEDAENKLIIRSNYSDEALVDSFCRDKIDFLKSIKNTDLACEYLLKTEDGFEGNITSVETEYPAGVPNFILKYRYPNYNKDEYPKLYRFDSIEDLMDFADSEEMPEDFFLMPYYFCEDELWEGRRIPLIREWSFFVANSEGGLDSIEIGRYTKLCDNLDLEKVGDWNGELDAEYREMFLSAGWYTKTNLHEAALLDEDDLVWMADGSWKKIQDLKVGEKVKSLEIPAKEGYDSSRHTGNYGISVEELEKETSYVENTVVKIEKLGRFDTVVSFKFTDGTDWYDTAYSSYPTVNSEGLVEFKTIDSVKEGDKVILINIEDTESPKFEVKEISSVKVERKLLESGYTVELNGSHLFISRTSEDAQAYAAIEHNPDLPFLTYCDEVLLCDGNPSPDTVTFSSGTDRSDGCYGITAIDMGASPTYNVELNNDTPSGYGNLTSCQYMLNDETAYPNAILIGETVSSANSVDLYSDGDTVYVNGSQAYICTDCGTNNMALGIYTRRLLYGRTK